MELKGHQTVKESQVKKTEVGNENRTKISTNQILDHGDHLLIVPLEGKDLFMLLNRG